MASPQRAALLTLVLSSAPLTALAADGPELPFQRVAVGATLGGMGVAGGQVSFGFDPYAMVQLEATARLATGTQEVSADGSDAYPPATSGMMYSAGLILAKHNFWETINPGAAIRIGRSRAFDTSSASGSASSVGYDLNEVYASIGPYVEGELSDDHKLTFFLELDAGVWLNPSRRPPTDLLSLAWDGEAGGTMDETSQNFLLNVRIGVQFYPKR